MALYTGKGDKGTTKLFNCPPGVRISKSASVFEALGTLDELNSNLGYAKVLSGKNNCKLNIEKTETPYDEIIERIQQILFSVQAELGGSEVKTKKEHLDYLEIVIAEVEKELPPIKSFIVPGGGETGAYLDITRTLARRAERLVVSVNEKGDQSVGEISLQFLNRLSSTLYALARFANYQQGYLEDNPTYD